MGLPRIDPMYMVGRLWDKLGRRHCNGWLPPEPSSGSSFFGLETVAFDRAGSTGRSAKLQFRLPAHKEEEAKRRPNFFRLRTSSPQAKQVSPSPCPHNGPSRRRAMLLLLQYRVTRSTDSFSREPASIDICFDSCQSFVTVHATIKKTLFLLHWINGMVYLVRGVVMFFWFFVPGAARRPPIINV
jgi:hypothetical protein